MLREYVKTLYGVYQKKGLITAMKSFGNSVGEYLTIEANSIKLKQIQGNTKPFSKYFHNS